MKISRTNALKVLVHCGFKQVLKWENLKLGEKLAAVGDVVPDEKPEDESTRTLLAEVLAKSKEGFEVFDDETSKEPTVEKKNETAEGAAPKEPKVKKEKVKKEPKEPKAKKEPGSAFDRKDYKEVAGVYTHVRADQTNAHFVAGQIFQDLGLDAGVPHSFVTELKLRLKKDGKWDDLNLVHAWHAIRGYLGITATAPPAVAQSAADAAPKAAAPAEAAKA